MNEILPEEGMDGVGEVVAAADGKIGEGLEAFRARGEADGSNVDAARTESFQKL